MTVHANKSEAGALAYTLVAANHVLQVDVPESEGGDDLGPSPHDLFDAALAGCTALTLSLYARRKGWPLEDARVTVERDARDESSGIYRLARRIELVGELDAQQKERLLEVALHCPIHKLMQAEIKITTTSA
jgi:putative redox protein